MSVMGTGTTYKRRKDGKAFAKRFHECKKCHDRIYTKELNFQECMNKTSGRYRNK